MGNNESIEPFTSNMYNRRVLAGEFTIVNKVKYLLSAHTAVYYFLIISSDAVSAERFGGARPVDS